MTEPQASTPGERPFRDFLTYVVNARSLLDLTAQAADFTVHVNSRMRETYERIGPDELAEFDGGATATLAEIASKELANDFPLMHAHALVGLWGALESCIDGICEEWLEISGEEAPAEALGRLRVSLGDYLAVAPDDRWRWVLEQLKRDSGSELKKGVGQFDTILNAVGIGGPIDAEVRIVLHQAKAIRNLIAHKGGRVDARFIADCPDFGYAIGDEFKLTRDQTVAAFTAMVYFADSVWARVKSKAGLDPHDVELPPWFESLAELRSKMLPQHVGPA